MCRACTDRDRIFHDNGGTELKFEHNSLLRVKIAFLRDFKEGSLRTTAKDFFLCKLQWGFTNVEFFQ